MAKKPAETHQTPPRSIANYRVMSDVKKKDLEWLWYPYIPFGFITNIVGIGSAGKSTITSYIVSQVTKGRAFLHGEHRPDIGSVMIFEDEQGAEIGVKAQLDAHGADQNRVVYIDSVTNYSGQTEHFDITKDISALQGLFVKYRDMRVIVFDPISSFMGDTNCNDNAAVRRGLAPIQKFIMDRDIAMIAINHFSKNSERAIENKSLGSVAFYNVSRSEILIHRELDKDEDETGHVFFGTNKHNLTKGLNPPTLRYQMVDDKVTFSDQDGWPNMRNILAGKTKSRKLKGSSEEYREWLKEAVKGVGVSADKAKERADEMKVSRAQAYRIAKGLGIDTNGRNHKGVWK